VTVRRIAISRLVLGGMAMASVATLGGASLRAQDYPNHAIKLIVPTGPGGGYDVLGRLMADELSRRLGQSVYVENKTGAGTIVGTQSAIAAAPDGYTLLVG
jgi:tripartite-type tricarboxylate transporter receptor subunit TctC